MVRWLSLVAFFLPSAVLAQPIPLSGAVPITAANGGTGAISITAPAYGASTSNSSAANATAIQAAINAAVAAGVPLLIPAPPNGGCYNYTPPLTVSGNLTIAGNYAAGNWNDNINVPTGSPPIAGSVLCPVSNGSDAIDVSGASITLNVSNLGISFQTPFAGTGDGFHYKPTTTQGLSGSTWSNVWVYGHDGNHFGYNFENLIYNTFTQIYSYGGGGINLFGNGVTGNYGNSEFITPIVQVLVGGSAGGIIMGATAINNLNNLHFVAPEVGLVNQAGVTPGGNPPTGAQLLWSMDSNETNIELTHGGAGGNISGMTSVLPAIHNNYYDYAGGYWNSAIQSPAWTVNGIMLPSGNPQTFVDTTSSGTVAIEAVSAMPVGTIAASNATTLTHMASLYVPAPVAGANVTATTTQSIYATGEVATSSDFSAAGGAFISGTIQLNQSASTNTTSIGTGVTSGQVTIGAGSNKVAIGSGLTVGSTTALTTSTGELGLVKIAASGAAPGALGLKLEGVCGTTGGSMKIIAYAGTSTTPVTVIDNIGSGVTGC